MSLDYQHTERLIEVGAIVKPHGIRGEVKIHIYSGRLDFFSSFNYFFISEVSCLDVISIKNGNKCLIVRFKNFDSIDEVSSLINKKILVSQKDLDIEEGNFLIQDHMGLLVYNKIDKKYLGEIIHYLDVGTGLFEVKMKDGKKFYIPSDKKYLGDPNMEEKLIYLDDSKGFSDFAV